MSGTSPVASVGPDPFEAPAVAYATHYRFGPGEVLGPHNVASRKLVWIVSGRGTIRSAGRTIAMAAGSVVLLPWHHEIRYQADDSEPFFVGSVHVIPWHDPEHVIEPRASFGRDDPLWESPQRRDAPWPGFESMTVLHGGLAERMIALGEAAIEYFTREVFDPRILRAYGSILTSAALGAREDESPALPGALRAILEYARQHLDHPLDREDFARVAGCSVSTVERQFRRHLGRSPQAWLRETRLDLAARALATSTRRVSEVARDFGFDDPFHFSRVFRTRFGVPPSRYARREPML